MTDADRNDTLEHDDIQGIVVSSYSHLSCAAFVLLRIEDAAATQVWLRAIGTRITNAVKPADPPLASNVNVAITSSGLLGLGVPTEVIETFSWAFQDGMASSYRARILGDTYENDAASWRWGAAGRSVDLLLALYSRDEDELRRQLTEQRDTFKSGLSIVAILEAGRPPKNNDNREHFGFNDGVGQPVIAGTDAEERQLNRTQHATPIPAGDFLLGYPNSYGGWEPSPIIPSRLDPGSALPPVRDTTLHDLGRNGSYLVVRQMSQDVAGFWKYLDTLASGEDAERDRLGAKMVGRWRSGTPLVTARRDDPVPIGGTSSFNDFGYSDDPAGDACPIGSHIRRANPRDSLPPEPVTARKSANTHRLMRRGRSYGDRLVNLLPNGQPDPMPRVDDGKDRGLIFVCLNSDLERQFEFVQQTWINNRAFAELHDEVDPLIGNQHICSSRMTIPGEPLRRRLLALPSFVTVRGGAYFFLPGLRALRWLAAGTYADPH